MGIYFFYILGVNEQCRQVHLQSIKFYEELKKPDYISSTILMMSEKIKAELEGLEEMLKNLPSANSTELDVEKMDKQLEEEMKRMSEAIAAAVIHIDKLQRKRFVKNWIGNWAIVEGIGQKGIVE